MTGPSRAAFSEHALDQLARRGLSEQQVAETVLVGHPQRKRNPGSADWLVTGRRLEVVYNWPDRGDRTMAYIVSVWPE